MFTILKTEVIAIILLVFLQSCSSSSRPKEKLQSENLEWLEGWINAWEYTSDSIFNLPRETPPEMFFYDKKFVYTTSKISAPNGILINGPDLFGVNLEWKKQEHGDSMTLPSGTVVPVKLMSFASTLNDSTDKTFFVMAAPQFWIDNKEECEVLGLEKHLTGVFLHEFSHTRQFKWIHHQVNVLETDHNMDSIPLSDDMIQDFYEKDSSYERLFRDEVDRFYTFYLNTEYSTSDSLNDEALKLLRKRQSIISNDSLPLIELDNIFLSLEGLGQFAMFSWLIDPKGGNVSIDKALEGTRRGKNWWSQEEGLALFLAYDKICTTNWLPTIFDKKAKSIVELLQERNEL